MYVSEITRFYCKPDMTSSRFLRQGSLHAILHDGFWKSEHDFLMAFHSNFLSVMHGFRDNEVLLLTGYDFIVDPPPGGRCTTFSGRILKERPWLPNSLLYQLFMWDAWFPRLSGFISSRIWRHLDFSARGAARNFFVDSERVTPILY